MQQINTGHCETTRDNYYVHPATEAKITKLLDGHLQLLNDPEACYVTADEPPQLVPESGDGSNIFEEEPDNEDYAVNPSCEFLEHERTALTQESQATDKDGNFCQNPDVPRTSKEGTRWLPEESCCRIRKQSEEGLC